MLREALALGAVVRTGAFAGVTRADMPAAPTGVLRPDDYDPDHPGPRPPGNRRRWVTAGLTAVLCAAAAATGLYLSGHLHGQTSGDVGNTVQHLSSSAVPSSASTSQPVTTSPTPSTVEPSTVPASSVSPKPRKSTKPTSSPKISPSSSSPGSSSSSSTSASASSSSSASASASASSSSPKPTS